MCQEVDFVVLLRVRIVSVKGKMMIVLLEEALSGSYSVERGYVLDVFWQIIAVIQ